MKENLRLKVNMGCLSRNRHKIIENPEIYEGKKPQEIELEFFLTSPVYDNNVFKVLDDK